MNQREFDRTAETARHVFCRLIQANPGISDEALAEQAWAKAKALEGVAGKHEPDDAPREAKRTKVTA